MGTHTYASEQHTHIQKHSNNKQHRHLLSQKNVCSNHGTFMELSTKAKMATVGVGMKKSSPDHIRKAMRGPLMQDIPCWLHMLIITRMKRENIRGQMKEKGVKWEDFFIVSKLWATFFERKLLNGAVRSPSGSGTRLGLSLFSGHGVFSPESFPPSDKVNVLTSKITFLDVGKGREDLVNEELVKVLCCCCCSLLCSLRVLPPSYQINTPRGLLLVNAQY